MVWIHTPAGGGTGVYQNVSDALVVWLQDGDVTLQVLRQGVLRRFLSTERESIERVWSFVAAYPWVQVDAPDGWMKFVNVQRMSEIRKVRMDRDDPDSASKMIFTVVYDAPGGEEQHVELLAELTHPEKIDGLCRWLEENRAR